MPRMQTNWMVVKVSLFFSVALLSSTDSLSWNRSKLPEHHPSVCAGRAPDVHQENRLPDREWFSFLDPPRYVYRVSESLSYLIPLLELIHQGRCHSLAHRSPFGTAPSWRRARDGPFPSLERRSWIAGRPSSARPWIFQVSEPSSPSSVPARTRKLGSSQRSPFANSPQFARKRSTSSNLPQVSNLR